MISGGRSGHSSRPDLAQHLTTSTHKITGDQGWGDDPKHKTPRTLRVGFLNINTFPTSPFHPKNTLLRTHLTDHEIDISCLAELNTQWSLIHPDERLKERVRPWWAQSATNVSYNSINTRSSFQPGGSAIICVDKAAARLFSRGEDQSKLGRWCWVRLRGRGGVFLRVISAYHPCQSTGPHSTYMRGCRTG